MDTVPRRNTGTVSGIICGTVRSYLLGVFHLHQQRRAYSQLYCSVHGPYAADEVSSKVIAALYSKLQFDPKITPSVLTNIHKLLHSAFEQAVLWEYVPRNPLQKANVPDEWKGYSLSIPCGL